ncbi:MAG: hypothetical protein CL760_02205 [Chloroflexi bacterium]|nr:hypothetical protein [Chloroflexota bacterium]MQG05736.1 hypothetical protein [SAR202 cluster bacterium]
MRVLRPLAELLFYISLSASFTISIPIFGMFSETLFTLGKEIFENAIILQDLIIIAWIIGFLILHFDQQENSPTIPAYLEKIAFAIVLLGIVVMIIGALNNHENIFTQFRFFLYAPILVYLPVIINSRRILHRAIWIVSILNLVGIAFYLTLQLNDVGAELLILRGSYDGKYIGMFVFLTILPILFSLRNQLLNYKTILVILVIGIMGLTLVIDRTSSVVGPTVLGVVLIFILSTNHKTIWSFISGTIIRGVLLVSILLILSFGFSTITNSNYIQDASTEVIWRITNAIDYPIALGNTENWSRRDSSWLYRQRAIDEGLRLISKSPFIGKGNGYETAFETPDKVRGRSARGYQKATLHNFHLTFMVIAGIPIYIFCMLFILIPIWKCIKYTRLKSHEFEWQTKGIIAATLAYLFALTGTVFGLGHFHTFWLFPALCLTVATLIEQNMNKKAY